MAYTMQLGMADLPRIYNVNFPVGPSRANARDDVLLVQTLIKMANFDVFSGGLPVAGSSLITVDGYFGPETKRMIVQFEDYLLREGAKFFVRDGFVSPSSKDGYNRVGVYKIALLNRKAKQSDKGDYDSLPFAPSTDPVLRAALMRGAPPPQEPPRDPSNPPRSEG